MKLLKMVKMVKMEMEGKEIMMVDELKEDERK